MINMFKVIRPSLFVIIPICTLVSYCYLKSTGTSDLKTMYQTIFGGIPLKDPLLKGLFIMILSLLQYTLIDYIEYYIDSSEYFFIRYKNKSKWLEALLKGAFIITATFVIMFYLLGLIFDFIYNNFSFIQTVNIITVGVVLRVFLFCMIIVLLQIFLLLKYTKTTTFMILGGISILLAITSYYRGTLFYILPRSSSPLNVLFDVLKSIVLSIVLITLIQRINHKRELIMHEN
ncbi:hypothetical protein QW71_35265 [Paenibacillus sp. IHB B 3415]|uniref:hypothetical protein n=1 Tax=Paenibacillus sp. IHB B 3415 TaxID=867080 RepID=UPI000573EC47|nr:hypothetical protein [Paenibacillus sp. IHB B 3415]KHL91326.1 hypothetical protein QW71_35265 [Paenibacillus sp. IHB B 3415]